MHPSTLTVKEFVIVRAVANIGMGWDGKWLLALFRTVHWQFQLLGQVKVETCSSGGDKLFSVRFFLLEIWELALKLLVSGRHSSLSAVELFSSVCKLTLRLDGVCGRLVVGGYG